MKLSFDSDNLANITQGKTNSDWNATGISIDTRTIKRGDLFCAIEGKKYDGHDFVKQAYQKGAVAALVKRKREVPDNKPYLKVQNVLKALEKIAKSNRKKSNAKFIAITGSVGKTGTKDMLKLALKKIGKIYANEGSFNNHIGVPLSLCKVPADAEYSILELGMNKFGEINNLSKIVMPEVGIITAIEKSHLSGLISLKNIVKAKCEILQNISKVGCFIFNNDTNYSDYMLARAKQYKIKNIISYGLKKTSDVRLLNYKVINNHYLIKANVLGKQIDWKMPLVNEHWIYNSLAVIALGFFYELNLKKVLSGLSTFKVPIGRGNKINCNLEGKKFTIINESYNSNPASLKSSLLAMSKEQTKGKKILILGDMLELGKNSLKIHLSFKDNITSSGAKILITKGDYMRELNKLVPENVEKYHLEKIDSLIKKTLEKIASNDLILVKGSNSIGLNNFIKKLESRLN